MTFKTFCTFLALKTHFNSISYDYFRFGGKLKLSESTFNSRNDRFMYMRLQKLIPNEQDMIEHIVANLLQEKKWIGEFLEEDSREITLKYRKQIQSITHLVDEELSRLVNRQGVIVINDIFKPLESKYPILLEALYESEVSYPMLTVLNSFIPFVSKFDNEFGKNDMLWSKPSRFITKLRPFIKFDRDKIISVLKKYT